MLSPMRPVPPFRTMQRAYSLSCSLFNEMVGKPDKISNIRPLKCHTTKCQTTAERRLSELRVETQNWHHRFWLQHNSSFDKMRKDYIEEKTRKEEIGDGNTKAKLDPEEMAVFHREFIELNKERNVQYDREWRQRNWKLILLMLQVQLQKVLHTFKKSD